MKFKLGLCQMMGSFDKDQSRATAKKMVEEAARNGAQVIALPEMWNCPYSNDYFRQYAEPDDGETVKFCRSWRRRMIFTSLGDRFLNWRKRRYTILHFLLIGKEI